MSMVPDPTELARVLSHYDTGVVRKIVEVRRGAGQSMKWAIACERGALLLKRRPSGVDERGLALIQEAQAAAAGAGFPVPESVAVRGGAALLRLEGRLYEMARFVSSTPFDESAGACAAAGAMLARLHALMSRMDVPEVAAGGRGFHRLLRVQTELVAAGKRLGDEGRRIAKNLGALYTLAGERADALGHASWPEHLIHGDWHPGNLLFSGSEIVGLIDFDSVRPGRRAADVAYGALQFSVIKGEGPVESWPAGTDEPRFEAFVRGYDGAGTPLGDAERQSLVWLMIEALIAETSGPLAGTGSFGEVPGLSMLRMIEAKTTWLRDHHARLASLGP